MGGYYAEKQGLPIEVSQAIRDHYKPVGQGDDVPTDPVTVWVSLADKLDTLVGFFAAAEQPTGSKDPFALRRAVISIIRIMTAADIRVPLQEVISKSYQLYLDFWFSVRNLKSFSDEHLLKRTDQNGEEFDLVIRYWKYPSSANWAAATSVVDGDEPFELVGLHWRDFSSVGESPFMTDGEVEGGVVPLLSPSDLSLLILDFFADRLKVQQREAGVRHDLIDAVFALGGEDDLVRLLARVKALQAFVETPDGVNLLAGYKRASNILKKEGNSAPHLMRSEAGGAGGGQGSASSAEHASAPAQAGAHLPTAETDATVRDGLLPAQGNNVLSYTPEKAEKALIDALDAAQPEVTAAIAAEQFEKAMTALAALRGPIDQFFEDVTVNDDDEAKREARLALLARFRNAVHQVADFSQIEG